MAGPGLPTNRTLKSTPAQHRDDHNTAHTVLDLFDVDLTPVDGDVLTWDSGTNLWVPAANASGGGGGDIEDPFDPGFFIAGGAGAGNLSNAFLFVAASDASPRSKNAADYVCDGTADQVQILTAINALPANGGMVMLSEGNFVVDSSVLVEKDSVHLMGSGVGQKAGSTQSGVGTKITATGAITNSVVKVQRAANDRPVYGSTLTHFTVDVASVGSNVDAVLFRSNRGYIDHVHVHRATGHGFHVQGYSSPQWDTYDTTLAHVQAGDCANEGIFLDTNANDVHLTHPILYNNNNNLRLKGSSVQVTGAHTYDATINNIWFDGGGSRSKFANCKIEGAGQHGVNIDSTNGGYADIQFGNCNFSNNGDSADNTYDHLIQQGPSGNGIGRTNVHGCSFSWKGSGNKPRYGVNLNSSCSQNPLITGNTFGPASHFGTAALRNNSSTSLPATIRGNLNVPDDLMTSINVKQYGATGDGTTDDSTAINAAITAAAVTKGTGLVYFPGGDYRIGTTITAKQGVKLLGSGAHDASTQPGSQLRALGTLSGDVVKYPSGTGAIWHHGGLERLRIRDAPAGHGIFLQGGIGESTVIDQVMITGCSGDGLRIEGSSTPLHLGRIAPHSNGGAGLRLVTQTETHAQIVYLGGDNNGESLMTIDSLDTASSVHIVGWKAERWGASPGNPIVFLINNGNGALVDLGQGRVHIGSGVSAGADIIKQTSAGSVARLKWRLSYHNGGGADYANGYNDTLNSITQTITTVQRTSVWAGESIAFMKTSGNWIRMLGQLNGPGVWVGSGTPESTVTDVVGSLAMRTDGGAGTSLYVKQSGSGNTGWVGK